MGYVSRYKTFAILTFVALIWGGTFIFTNLIVQEIPPVLGAFMRFFIASVVLMGVLLFSKQKRTPLRKEDVAKVLILGLSGVFLYNYFFFWGLKFTTPVNGSLIIAANPATTTLLSALYLKEKITVKQLLGILISFFGVGLVITRGSWQVIASLSFNQGDMLLLVSMFSWGVFAIAGKEAMRRLSPLETITYATVVGTLMFVPFVIKPLQEFSLATIPFNIWVGILYMSIIASVIAFLLFYKALKEINASQAAIFVNMVPLFTMLISVMLGQSVFAMQVLGGALIIFGVAVTTNMIFHGRPQLQKQPPQGTAG